MLLLFFMFQVLFAAPVECVKIRQQVSRVKTTTFGMLREIVTQEGVLGKIILF